MAQFYTCFLHPQEVREENRLDDSCPDCGRPYSFVLDNPPDEVGDYRIVKPLGRGFYGATFLVESGNLNQRDVLKIAPAAVYEKFGKDFVQECQLHKEVADESEHLVPIRDYFDAPVRFGDVELDCHVAVIEYVRGLSLSEWIGDPSRFNARGVAQIAIDLFLLLRELEAKGRFHNDLHGENIRIRELGPTARRADAVDETIRTVAIDLGSIADASKSDSQLERLGDLHEVATHLLRFSERLLHEPDAIEDQEYRLAHALEEIAHIIAPDPSKTRGPNYTDFIDQIRDAALYSVSPWRARPTLTQFNEGYNAQTMNPYWIPKLLVDPDGDWLRRIAVPGPQIVTGTRGCGKTLLMRALEFHARAHRAEQESQGSDKRSLLDEDGYVGLYVSCNRLLDELGAPAPGLHEPYARLFVYYAHEALQALRHLRELDRSFVVPRHYQAIGDVVAAHLEGAEELAEVSSEIALDRQLQRKLVGLARGDTEHSLKANPAIVFPQLAQAIKACSPLWEQSQILFLLDDVSTRHLHEKVIEDLLSSLLFKDEHCAFKMTTEVQTLELALKSPGLIERAQPERDLELFDLGGEVNRRLRGRGQNGGREFLSKILEQRARWFDKHPEASPEEVLGNTTLESIARRIASTKASRQERKAIYHGVTALTAVCVGDIGDVISLYDTMLRHWNGRGGLPIPPETQSRCYQDQSVRRLYHLNRRDPFLRKAALSFSKAAHELLVRSYKRQQARGGKGRLRQYTTLHVTLDRSAPEQFDKLRELIDAGVFVFEGGSETPRVRARDSDPVTQFVLNYRKLFGLSQFIGIAERDRFELSGEDLAAWLDDPDPKFLTRNLRGDVEIDMEVDEPEMPAPEPAPPLKLFDAELPPEPKENVESIDPNIVEVERRFLENRIPRARRLSADGLRDERPQTVLGGLGFEDRALTSAERLYEEVKPQTSILVAYDEQAGHGQAIEKIATEASADTRILSYSDLKDPLDLPSGPIVIDVTALPKSVIFSAVRTALVRDGRVFIAHTRAEEHYPLNRDIEKHMDETSDSSSYAVIAAMKDLFSGDYTPYEYEKLLSSDGDETRRRILCAGVSAKHERLLSLLDEREYDRLEMIVPNTGSWRSKLARHAAEVARDEVEASVTEQVHSDDLEGTLEFLGRRYRVWYGELGFDVEFGLTGSKMQAVAAAALSTQLKIAQCWYVKPSGFDPERFSIGSGETQYFEISSTKPEAEDI